MGRNPLEKGAMYSIRGWRWWVLLILILGTGWGVAPGAETGQPVLKVGVCLPLADPAGEGIYQRNALAIAHKVRPLAGDRPVQLIIKDTRGTSPGVREAVAAILGEAGVCGIIGGATTEEAAVMLDAVAKNKRAQREHAPVIVTTASGPLGAPPGAVWRMCSPHTAQAQAAAAFAMRRLKLRRAAVMLDPSDQGSVRLASLFSAAFIAQGGTVDDIAYLEQGEGDYGNLLARLTKKRPEVIFIPYTTATASMITHARSHGLKTPFLVTNVWHTGSFIKALRSSKDVYLLTDFYPGAATSANARRFLDEFRKVYGEADAAAVLAADAYFLLTDSAARSDGKGRIHLKQLITVFQDNGYLSGEVGFDKAGNVVRTIYACLIQDSRVKYMDAFRP